jgi:tetratricopeptide (TPR) repeat protein
MANALAELAVLADWRGDRASSVALTEEALDLAGQLDSAEDVADLLCRRAEGSIRAGDLASAHADYERVAELTRRASLPEKLAEAHRGLGEVARLRGELAEARRCCEVALAECPTEWFSAEGTRSAILIALGWIAEAEGDPVEARAWHHQAVTAAVRTRGFTAVAGAVEGLAGVALLDGDAARAALLLGAARALRGAPVAGDPDVARVSAAARARLGDIAYEQAYQRGAAMTRDETLTLLG